MRRGGSQPAAGAAQNLARCDILREQSGRRPARDCVKRRTAAGPVCVTAIGRSVITYFCLLSISDGALERKRRGKRWWSDGRDRQIRIFRCSKRNFRLRLYRNIPLSAALCSCKRVRLSDFFCGSLLNGFFRCGQLTHGDGVSITTDYRWPFCRAEQN